MTNDEAVKLATNIVFKESGGRKQSRPSGLPPVPGAVRPNHRSAGRSEFSKSSWQRERIRLLQAIFIAIEQRVANGSNVSRELRRAARRWAGRCYRTAPTKLIAFSEESLERWFYAWRRGGRTAAALELNYKPAEEKLAPEFGTLLAGLVLETDALSFAAVIREIERSGMAGKDAPAPSTFLRKLPTPVRLELRGVIRKRYALRQAERKARKVLEACRP